MVENSATYPQQKSTKISAVEMIFVVADLDVYPDAN